MKTNQDWKESSITEEYQCEIYTNKYGENKHQMDKIHFDEIRFYISNRRLSFLKIQSFLSIRKKDAKETSFTKDYQLEIWTNWADKTLPYMKLDFLSTK